MPLSIGNQAGPDDKAILNFHAQLPVITDSHNPFFSRRNRPPAQDLLIPLAGLNPRRTRPRGTSADAFIPRYRHVIIHPVQHQRSAPDAFIANHPVTVLQISRMPADRVGNLHPRRLIHRPVGCRLINHSGRNLVCHHDTADRVIINPHIVQHPAERLLL